MITLDQSALEAAACEYDDANDHESIPARDAAYKGFLAGARWAADCAVWVPWAKDGPRPPTPGTYLVTKASARLGQRARVCAAAHWDGGRFLNAANVLAWRPLPGPWEDGGT